MHVALWFGFTQVSAVVSIGISLSFSPSLTLLSLSRCSCFSVWLRSF